MSPSESGSSSKPPEPSAASEQGPIARSRFWQILLTLLAVETGTFLLVIPWTSTWDWTLLEGSFGALAGVLRNHFLRGAISAVGLLSLWVGLVEALFLTGLRRA